ncbi:DUF3810 domain-containing protein [Aurantibacter crassamenti]|uniref:DUF3810 domain-containing protein n=1 Tax=Aurantibacter crassamenti TaxID=1837375 RepID=UPI0019398E56|nr:DUF3810 domain-containing protein [Aurantibacter crassamenti]MBM1106685.1 DUF3810 domain-containing protein [Aurantibacter crassamenti]
MRLSLKNLIAIAIVPQILLVKWLASKPDLIENYYSNGIYPLISQIFRTLLGWIPFSVGDILYAILIILALKYLIRNRQKIRYNLLSFARDIVMVLSIAYFTFHLLWGLNYHRQPINKHLNIEITYTQSELVEFTSALIEKSNTLQFQITSDTALAVNFPYSKSEVLKMTEIGYKNLGLKYPEWHYPAPSIKKSLFSTALTYMGYGGYLNPFTNEAQVNGLIPKFRFPFIGSHEVGHQLGYSAENETNFIGYLAAISNEDLYFQYSAYTYMIGYCLNDLQVNDKETFNRLYATLNPGILKNYQEVTDFWLAHANPLEPVFKSVFNSFLKANNQKDGIESYSKVVALLINYHQKYPL